MMKINKLEIENVKRVKAVKVEPAANGLMTIGLLGIVFLAIFAEANFKTSTYLFIMSVLHKLKEKARL